MVENLSTNVKVSDCNRTEFFWVTRRVVGDFTNIKRMYIYVWCDEFSSSFII